MVSRDKLSGDSVIVVTGASAGIGREICLRLARRGGRYVLAARSADRLVTLQAELRSLGVDSLCVATDVSDPNDLERLVEQTMKQFGRIDVLINNAGVDCFCEFEKLTTEQILQTIEINLTGSILLARLVVPIMRTQSCGAIINMASTAGKHGPAFGAVYGATKAGLIGFTQGLRGELLQHGISVTAICPGFTEHGGIYDRIVESTGKQTSKFVGGTTTQQVAAAVEKAIDSGVPEMIVNWPPMRPVFLLRDLFPRLGEKIILMASRKFLKRAAMTKNET
jgi:short-subunit dehydrogenase